MTNTPERKPIPQNAELNDDDLEMVSGGTELQVPMVGTKRTTCDNFICCWCRLGKEPGKTGHYCEPQGGLYYPEASWFDYICHWCDKLHTCPYANRPQGVLLPPT